MRIFLLSPNAPNSALEDPPGVENYDLELGGIYFFLYPFFLQIERETGQLIDPYKYAHFGASALATVLLQLRSARDAAESAPDSFSQRVGRQFRPEPKVLYETVDRAELLATIDILISAAQNAQASGEDLYVTERYD